MRPLSSVLGRVQCEATEGQMTCAHQTMYCTGTRLIRCDLKCWLGAVFAISLNAAAKYGAVDIYGEVCLSAQLCCNLCMWRSLNKRDQKERPFKEAQCTDGEDLVCSRNRHSYCLCDRPSRSRRTQVCKDGYQPNCIPDERNTGPRSRCMAVVHAPALAHGKKPQSQQIALHGALRSSSGTRTLWIVPKSTCLSEASAWSRSAHHEGRKRSAMMRNHGDHLRPLSGRIMSASSAWVTHLKSSTSSGLGATSTVDCDMGGRFRERCKSAGVRLCVRTLVCCQQ